VYVHSSFRGEGTREKSSVSLYSTNKRKNEQKFLVNIDSIDIDFSMVGDGGGIRGATKKKKVVKNKVDSRQLKLFPLFSRLLHYLLFR
jgi:hypothetical protein